MKSPARPTKKPVKRSAPRPKPAKGLPLSGYEPLFNPTIWDTPEGIAHSNCYSYGLNDYSSTRVEKAMPGARARRTSSMDVTKCGELRRRLLADNPKSVYAVKPMTKCQKEYFKMMMFVDSTGGSDKMGDFHFYKQHRDVMYKVLPGDTVAKIARFFKVPAATLQNMTSESLRVKAGDLLMVPNANVWSHKLGHATGALLKDSCGRVIKDPRKACRKYSYNYDTLCGAYCVKKNRAHSK
jgi:hypothetical protein